jgi:rod shape determining protein RodA
MLRNFAYVKKFDWMLFGAPMLLSAIGLIVLYSTSLSGTATGGDFSNFWKQAAFLGTGVLLVLALPAFNYRQLSGMARLCYVVALALLAAVLLFGETIRGTTGWFRIGGLGFQPVEAVKFLLIVFLARFFSDYARDVGGLRTVAGSGVAVMLLFLLVVLQPDFGSAFLLLLTWGAMLLLAGVRRTHLAVLGAICLLTAIIAWSFILKPYQKDRIAVFWDPARDPLGQGYNVTQSVIAIGSGGLFGRGLGSGSQSQLRFLPERQTDFIFAVLAEELGYLGVLLVCALFATLVYRMYRLAAGSRDDFTLFLTLGIATSIAVEAFVNIGGNLRLMPVTGVTLPFVSYGGSSLLVKFLMIGMLEAVVVRR